MKKNYMEKLERAARWRLPREEAEDVIADYRDIVADEELLRGLDRPRDVVKPLTQPKQYRIWLAVFFVLSACILIPGISPQPIAPGLFRICFRVDTWGWAPLLHLGPVFALVGVAGALVWFRRMGRKEGRLPKALAVLLAVLLACLTAVLAFDWFWMRDPNGFAAMWGETPPFVLFGLVGPIGPAGQMVSRSVHIFEEILQNGGTLAALLGVFGLVKARMNDRRWAAVYVLSMAVMLLAIESLRMLIYVEWDLGYVNFLDTWRHYYMWRYLLVFAAGIGGPGVALC